MKLPLFKDKYNNKFNISIDELKKVAAEDWDDIKDNPDAIESLSDLIHKRNKMNNGGIPDNYTSKGFCESCGEIPIPPEMEHYSPFIGCMWCSVKNKKQG